MTKQGLSMLSKKSNYSSVMFYQAEYDEEIQKINVREKSVWNTKSK